MSARIPRRDALLGATLAALLLGGCGAGREARAGAGGRAPGVHEAGYDPSLGPLVVFGCVVEASTGEPVPGATVRGPGGLETRTDAEGRFELAGLPAGAEGTLEASGGEGLTGTNRLRPRSGGRLEVVIYLR